MTSIEYRVINAFLSRVADMRGEHDDTAYAILFMDTFVSRDYAWFVDVANSGKPLSREICGVRAHIVTNVSVIVRQPCECGQSEGIAGWLHPRSGENSGVACHATR